MVRERQSRLFNGEGFFEDSFAPMPAAHEVTRIAINNPLKAASASTDKLLDTIDNVLDQNTPDLSYEAPPDEPRRPERYSRIEEVPIPLRILAITAIDETTGQFFEPFTP